MRRVVRGLACRRYATWTINSPRWGLPLADGALGTVSELFCEVGSRVHRDEVVAVIETDKIAVDIRSQKAGRVTRVLVERDAEVVQVQPLYELKDLTADEQGLRFGAGGASEDDAATPRADRMWFRELRRQRADEAQDQQRQWHQWQRRWQKEQSARWEHWSTRQGGAHQEPWWRASKQQQQHTFRQHQQQQQQQWQQQRQRQPPRQPPPPSSSPWSAQTKAAEALPPGEVRRILLAHSHHEVLELKRSVGVHELKSAFRRLAQKCHPDKLSRASDAERSLARDAFLRLQEAYQQLRRHPGR